MTNKASFSADDINSAITVFVANTIPRQTFAFGKSGEVTIYGENSNKRKPPADKDDYIKDNLPEPGTILQIDNE